MSFSGYYRNVNDLDRSTLGPNCIDSNRCGRRCCCPTPLPKSPEEVSNSESYSILEGYRTKKDENYSILEGYRTARGKPNRRRSKERSRREDYIPIDYLPVLLYASGGSYAKCFPDGVVLR